MIPGQSFLSRYVVEAELGRGAFGIVYRAHDSLLDRTVAIKLLSQGGLGSEGRARMLREAQSVARLDNPHIVTVYDVGELEGTPFIIMQLVSGVSLQEFGRLTFSQAIRAGRQLCEALEHAHTLGVIHRDIKPENVILSGEGKHLHARLMDFSLAHSARGLKLTQEGAIVGTPAYLAPEIILGQAASVHSDLYSLGATLFEAATGRPPFEGDSFMALLAQHLNAPVPPPSEVCPDLPQEFDRLIMRLLAKQPEDRPTSAAEVRQALEALEDRPESLFPALPVVEGNLPEQLTSFIGRESEVAEVKKLLLSSRLVTLTGVGGSGKTRLGHRVASDLQPTYPQGAWLIDLAPVSDPSLVPQVVNQTLGFLESSQNGRQPVETLAQALRERNLLIVLDNCEHLVEACASLAEFLLHRCPRLRILTTSREGLGVPGEALYPVPSLSLPQEIGSVLDPANALVKYEAIRLFTERAQAALPGFALTPANVQAVANICRRLDGIPLAIELAAARIKFLRVEEIAVRLENSFRLLAGGSRTALPRHQTLRALVDWSWRLLSRQEQVLLRRLAVFAGGWTLESAEAVCAGEGVESDEVLNLLAQLENKSLLALERKPGSEARYRLLETIRQYASEKLWEAEEGELVREKHLAYYLVLAERAAPALISREQILWLDRLNAERDNLRVALGWAIEADAEALLRLVAALSRYWAIRGDHSEAQRWLKAALNLAEGQDTLQRTVWRANALLASLEFESIDEIRLRRAVEAREIYLEVGDQDGAYRALTNLANAHLSFGDFSISQRLAEESLQFWRSRDEPWECAFCLWLLAEINEHNRDYHQAWALHQESLEHFRKAGDRLALAVLFLNLSNDLWFQGKFAEADSLVEENLAFLQSIGNKVFLVWNYAYFCEKIAYQGDYARARSFGEMALSLSREAGSNNDFCGALERLVKCCRLEGDLDSARCYADEFMRLANSIGNIVPIGISSREAGVIATYNREYERAKSLLEESLKLLEPVHSQRFLPFNFLYLGDLALQQGEVGEAEAHFLKSLDLSTESDSRVIQLWSLERLAQAASRQGQAEKAAWLFGATQAERQRLELPVPAVDRPMYDQCLEQTQAQLGKAAFEAAYKAGQKMGLEEAAESL